MEINKIYVGDCSEILSEIKKTYAEDMIIVSDPPFNVGYHYNEYSDNMGADEYYEFMQQIFGDFPSVVIHYPEELYKIAFQIGKFPEKIVSWVYNSNTAKQHRDIAFFDVKPNFKKLGQPYKNPTDKRIMKRIAEGKQARGYDWWNINQVKNVSKDKTGHPCQMPLEVMENIIKLLPEEKIIVDPFMGSGTTMVACKKLGRRYIGIEMSVEYANIAEQRLALITASHYPNNH